ncbi:MAG TPA: hypothetical protein VE173_15435, partial [Longimicrobiales bacterium]|nr:hypothetical protein [Longimicrobiales bacterium]
MTMRLVPWIGILLLAAWTASPHPAWLLLATAALLTALVAGRRGRSRLVSLALLTGLAAVPVAFAALRQMSRLRTWDDYWEAREASVFADLTSALEEVVDAGDAAVDSLARAADAAGGSPPYATVHAIRRRSGLPAA